jgi:hypothetical protein
VAPDGTFWIGSQLGEYNPTNIKLMHFGPSGTLLGEIPLDGRVHNLADVQAHGDDLWVADGSDPFYNIHMITNTGQVHDIYQAIHWIGSGLRLMFNEAGDVLLENWVSSQSPASVQRPDKRLDGYSWGGQLYSTWTEPPTTENPERGHYFAVGDRQFTLSAPAQYWDLSILSVLVDHSFYLIINASDKAFDRAILHFSADGVLLAGAMIPRTDYFDDIMHRVAVSPDGSVYLLTLNREVVRLEFGSVVGFSITPGGPPVPLLANLLADSLGVAEVDMAPVRDGDGWGSRAQKAYVRRWLTAPLPDTGNVIGLLKTEEEDDALAQGSGHYILFLQTPTDVRDCEARGDFFGITRGLRGILEVRDGRISATRLPAYQGWTVDQFAAELNTLPPPSTPRPSNKEEGFERPPATTLTRLVHESVFIAEGTVRLVEEYGFGEAGGIKQRDWEMGVQTWLKKPADWALDTIPFSTFNGPYGDTQMCRMGLGANHYILFFYESPSVDSTGASTGRAAKRGFRLTDYMAGIFGIEGDEIDYGGIRSYWGMPVAQFEQEILAIMAGPTPTSTPAEVPK